MYVPIGTEIEVNKDDAQVINSIYRATLTAEHGYCGPVFVDVNRLYEIHGQQARMITRAWIRILMHDNKK